MTNIERVHAFIKECDTYYLATTEGDQPRVRPFGTINLRDGKLEILTNRNKDVARQIFANPWAEICCFKGEEWLRLSGKLLEDESIEAKEAMLENYPHLRSMYDAKSPDTLLLYFSEATARFFSYSKPEEKFNV